MRRRSCILALGLMGVLSFCSPVWSQPYSQHSQHSGAQVDVGVFYDGLSPYGDWVEMPDYGWSWAPRVERGWRPYTRGQWVMTDDGWFWDSDEQFGWAAYHYGRWIHHPYYGWIWVPGTEWAPAWVSWRYGGGYTGWAPLPPSATWQTHVGLNIGGLDIDAFIGAGDYAFVPNGAFVNHGVYQQILPPTQNVTIINVTKNVTKYTVVNQRVFNGGIAVANVEKAVGRRVTRARTVDVDRFDAPKGAKAGEVAVFRPQVKVAAGKRPAEGKSLVKGDEPPQRLVERRKESEQERQKGNTPDVTAKDVQKQQPASQRDVKPEQQAAQRQHEQPHQPALKEQTKTQAQRQESEKPQAAKQADSAHPKREVEAQAEADNHAKDAPHAKENPKGKGKKPKASPTPPPASEKE